MDESEKRRIIEEFINILEMLRPYAAEGSDEKTNIILTLKFLESGKVLDEDLLPIANKILEIAKRIGSYEMKREIELFLVGEKPERLTKSQKRKIKELIETLEFLKQYIEKKPYKSMEDRDALNLINLKILRLDEEIMMDFDSEVRSISKIALKVGSYEIKNEIELKLKGRKRRKLSEKQINKINKLIEMLELIKEFIERKGFKSSFDYEALFLINLKIHRIDERILMNFEEEFDSILKMARKVGNYELRKRIEKILNK
ncbi:hypothetical protein [Methanotorris formicicus]|uniref:Uncharacterized protein n=1 Tax=Methanotorris formicicus Mc-S-70 TaxID=647171 RepID=H1KY41_9EURY|nr:hypothetical protein [Methanotorris formicicus]EHP87593.1 hypothetical protein MetfoDRAFT_0714 [Methanotorris formicicus Mc-S-70]